MTIVDIIDTINALPDAVRMFAPVFHGIGVFVREVNAHVPHDVLHLVFFEDGSVTLVD